MRSMRVPISFAAACGAFVVGLGAFAATTASAGPSLNHLIGSWRGKGKIAFSDGTKESITCRAYYRNKSDGIGMALRCASAGYKVEIRSDLKAVGDKLTGSWEERTFNASGVVVGRTTANGITLKVKGGGFEGDMHVANLGGTQQVKIETTGIQMQAVEVKMAKLN